MPPKDCKFKPTKFYINGKEIPCEIHNIETTTVHDDIDDFGLHFNPNKEVSLSLESCKFSSKQFSKLFGIWDTLKWHQKLRIIISDWFKRI
jgi:hypothetical protein